MTSTLRVTLVDPSLFTAPYDAALTEGLIEAQVDPTWVVRPTRAGDRNELPPKRVQEIFYRWVDQAAYLPAPLRPIAKGLAHVWGLARLVWIVWRERPDIVHFQWVVLPLIDAFAMRIIQRLAPIVLTVHDTMPFNGERMSVVQRSGCAMTLRRAAGVIVHTQSGRQSLVAQGIQLQKIHVVPHGPLRLHAAPKPTALPHDPRWTFVLFGEIKPYKGLDVLVEAVAKLPRPLLANMRVVVAGRVRMDLQAVETRIAELGLEGLIELRKGRLSEQEMADLFSEADSFVFPYRQIDASGVYFLVKALGKWLIASCVGVFAEDLRDGLDGRLVDAESPQQLADALADAIGRVPSPASPGQDWLAIAHATRAVYEHVLASKPQGSVTALSEGSHR